MNGLNVRLTHGSRLVLRNTKFKHSTGSHPPQAVYSVPATSFAVCSHPSEPFLRVCLFARLNVVLARSFVVAAAGRRDGNHCSCPSKLTRSQYVTKLWPFGNVCPTAAHASSSSAGGANGPLSAAATTGLGSDGLLGNELERPPETKSKKKKQGDNLPSESVDRNFITAIRAMSDYLLKPSDLEGLRKTRRRSPFELEPPIVVFWRKDVEKRALDVWGDMKKIDDERRRRSRDYALRKKNLFHLKRMLKEYQEAGSGEGPKQGPTHALEKVRGSKRVVYSAIAINGMNTIMKFVAWIYTGSYSVFSEALHSLADTLNQCILAVGIYQSEKKADRVHPYGYTNAKYVASLISGVGIFCIGSGLSFYHGFEGLFNPHPVENLPIAFVVLAISLFAEGGTLIMAIKSIHKGAKENGMSFSEYVLEAKDPTVNVVLLEDAAAVVGVMIAAGCMGLTSWTGSLIPDAGGSVLVGTLLGAVAVFVIQTNSNALVGRSIAPEKIQDINQVLEEDVMVRAIHDVKGIDMGNDLVRYKAEVDIDGRQLTRRYLNSQDLERLLEETQQMKTIEELEAFLLKHGENIVDLLGAEIDRIEQKLKARFPELRHVDLEVL